MKRIYLILIIQIVLTPYSVFSTGSCPPSMDCSTVSYPYLTCPDGTRECMTYPFTFTPVKAPGKMCLSFTGNGPSFLDMPDYVKG